MIMRLIFTSLLMLVAIICYGQIDQKFNLNFDKQNDSTQLPEGWTKMGQYEVVFTNKKSESRYVSKITSINKGQYGAITYEIPAKYIGDSIKLEANIKTSNVEKGYAGLFIRIDGAGNNLFFENGMRQKIKGTRDWQKYHFTINYPEDAEKIYIGGCLIGDGEAWFSDFVLTIDSKNVQTLKEDKEIMIPKAREDKEFDSGSKVEFSNINSDDIKNLELLGRIWGFLKYHHPAIATGDYNWDYELFRFLPKYNKISSVETRDSLLIEWIDSYGKIEKCTDCGSTSKTAILKPDHQWIDQLQPNLKEKLTNVYNNRSQGRNYYIGGTSTRFPNPIFKNEGHYMNISYSDAGFKLLALYRYWNMVNYFFPYKNLTDKDWNNLLIEYIPIFLRTKDELEYELALSQLIAEINDTHGTTGTGFDKMNKWKGSNYPPVHVKFIENQLVVTDYFNPKLKDKVGLEIGDVITKIQGNSVDSIVREVSKYYPASNTPALLRKISADILRSDKDSIDISIMTSTNSTENTKLTLYPKSKLNWYANYKVTNDKSYKMLQNDIGYITLANIQKEDVPKIKDEFKNTKGMIIDIRNYPNASVYEELGEYFISTDTPFVKYTEPNFNNPGEFIYQEPTVLKANKNTYKGKIIVLVNEITQSHAEYTAMAFRTAKKTTIIGSTTAASDGNVSYIYLPGGIRTRFTGLGMYYPDGTETQRVGIIPDIEVIPTIEGIRQGKDELMDKAIEVINN